MFYSLKIELLTKYKSEFNSDEDDFYDRTKKKKKSSSGEQHTVETADSLLDKRDLIINEMEMIRKSLEDEKNQLASTGGGKNEDGDDLDAYMTGLSSQLGLLHIFYF